MPWRPLPLSYAVAVYPFQPSSAPSELPLQIGDQLYVIEQGGDNDGWCRGYLVQPPSLVSALSPGKRAASDARVFSGIFPRCCIEIREQLGSDATAHADYGSKPPGKPPAPVPMLKIGDESATSTIEPLVDEIASCMREWYVSHLPELVLRQEYHTLDKVADIFTRLDYARRELLNDVLTAEERTSVRQDAIWDLVRGNKLLGAEIIVRDAHQKGRLLSVEDSAIDIAQLQATMSLLDEPPTTKVESTRLHHCSMEIKSVQGSNVDNVNLTFALYKRSTDGTVRQLSETFTSAPTPDGKTLFSDLSAQDISEPASLYLVAKASMSVPPKMASSSLTDRPPSRNGTVRGTRDSIMNRRRSNLVFGSKRKQEKPQLNQNGKFSSVNDDRPITQTSSSSSASETKKKPLGPPIPRTVAVAIANVGSIITSGKEYSSSIHFWAIGGDDEEEETGWDALLPTLLRSHARHYVRYKILSSISLELRPFLAADAETLIRMNPTSMHQIAKSAKIGFSEAPTRSRSDIYLTLSKVDLQQNGSFSHPQHGTVPVKPAPMLNLQLTMELRDSNGRRIERCIYASSNGPAVTALRTNAVELHGLWDQTLCLRLPSDQVTDAHIVLSIADAPGFPFALAWMPLWDKNAFIKDGHHALILHAYDKSTSTFSDSGKGMYLSLPWNQNSLAVKKDPSLATIASVQVITQLVSTEFSQDGVLANLFNWRALSSASLMDTLQKLVFVPEIEIVKQLNEVLDCLFAVLQDKAGIHKFEDLIFNDIVFVLGIVHDRRYNLGPLVERYADHHFEAPVVAPSLVRSFTRLLQSVSDPQSARDMRALFKVGKQFMRLLMATYWQQQRPGNIPEGEVKHQSFKQDMKAVFFGLQMMMRSETAALVGSKTLLVQNFHSWLPELLTVYSQEEVINIAVEFVDACEESTGKLALYRLVLIINYTKLDQLWINPSDWETLIEHCHAWLSEHWPNVNDLTDDWRDQIRLCCSVVAALLQRPSPTLHKFMPAIIATYGALMYEPPSKKWSLSLLFPTTYPLPKQAVETADYFDESLLELAALASQIISIKSPSGNKAVDEDIKTHVMTSLHMVQSLVTGGACPASWLSLYVYYHSSAIEILDHTARQLQNLYLPEPEEAETFEMELWKLYLDTLLSIITSPSLTLESFSEQKRRAVWKIAGDVRQQGADLLRASWAALGWEATDDDQRRYGIGRLGGYQVQYVPSLVGPIIEVCLSMHEGLRRVGVDILQTMIISEWALNEDLTLIETEVIGALNSILKQRSETSLPSSNEIVARKLFVGELLESFSTIANQPNDELWTTLEELVSTIEELIDLLSSNESDTEVDARRSGGTDHISSPEVPVRSISRLEGNVHGNHALEVYKQLAEEYERSGDYRRLAKTHRAIARIHETRATSASKMNHREEDGIVEDELEDEEH